MRTINVITCKWNGETCLLNECVWNYVLIFELIKFNARECFFFSWITINLKTQCVWNLLDCSYFGIKTIGFFKIIAEVINYLEDRAYVLNLEIAIHKPLWKHPLRKLPFTSNFSTQFLVLNETIWNMETRLVCSTKQLFSRRQ